MGPFDTALTDVIFPGIVIPQDPRFRLGPQALPAESYTRTVSGSFRCSSVSGIGGGSPPTHFFTTKLTRISLSRNKDISMGTPAWKGYWVRLSQDQLWVHS